MTVTTTFYPDPMPPLMLTSSKIEQWNQQLKVYEELEQRKIQGTKELEKWLLDWNEIALIFKEEFGRIYINFTTKTTDELASKQYEYYFKNITPAVEQFDFRLNKKLLESPYFDQIDLTAYQVFIRSIRNSVSLYSEQNAKKQIEERLLVKQYRSIIASVRVEIEGKKYTLQQSQSGKLLEEIDRTKREQSFKKGYVELLKKQAAIEQIFDQLLRLRQAMAREAGFDNYRDYKFKELGRFDYDAQDCLTFHESVKKEILPLLAQIHERKAQNLQIAQLCPWDLFVDAESDHPLQHFRSSQDLVEKATNILTAVHPYFGDCLKKMKAKEHLDLETRSGKVAGGYTMSLPVSGIPFMFMNISGAVADFRTFIHESGHAVQFFLLNEQPLVTSKLPPPEIAELAAMSMELLTLDQWTHFFPTEQAWKRAKIWLLSNVLWLLPWICIIDRFQHWLYTHPEHSRAARKAQWLKLLDEFNTPMMNRTAFEETMDYTWFRQLHLFEVPFYYIEYAMAQLGAIAIWKNYKERGQIAIEQYISAMKLGYSRPIKEVYAKAGIAFDFSREYIREIAHFLKAELDSLLES
ncbi:MAG: M3 family oligoendopeptidase [Bacteroidota bacterium]